MILSDMRKNETVTKGRKRFCLLKKQKQRQAVHKGRVKPEVSIDMESQQR